MTDIASLVNVEIVDLVDENDMVIDTLPRDEVYTRGLKYLRVSEAFVRNSKGELWIPVRRTDKVIAPGGFDIGAAGHVEHGETYDEAFRKETREELGWNIDQFQWKKIGKFGPKDGLRFHTTAYEIQTDQTPELFLEDYSSAAWMKPEDVAREIHEGHPAKANLLTLLEKLYGVTQ